MLCSVPLRRLLLVGKVFKWLILRLVSVRSGRELRLYPGSACRPYF